MAALYRENGQWFVRARLGRGANYVVGNCHGLWHALKCYWNAFMWELSDASRD